MSSGKLHQTIDIFTIKKDYPSESIGSITRIRDILNQQQSTSKTEEINQQERDNNGIDVKLENIKDKTSSKQSVTIQTEESTTIMLNKFEKITDITPNVNIKSDIIENIKYRTISTQTVRSVLFKLKTPNERLKPF